MDLRPQVRVARRALRQKQHRILVPHRVAVVDLAEESRRIRKLALELVLHLLAHREAACPNPWTNRRYQVLRLRPELQPHRPHAALHDPRQRPAPTRMERRHRPRLRVGDQHRHAVRGLDTQQQPALPRHQCIATQHGSAVRRRKLRVPHISILSLRRMRCGLTDDPHHPTMNLPYRYQLNRAGSRDRPHKPLPVPRNDLSSIIFRPAEILCAPVGVAINRRPSALPSAEPRPQPRISVPPGDRDYSRPLPRRRLARARLPHLAFADALAVLPTAPTARSPPVLQIAPRQDGVHRADRLLTLQPICHIF